MIMKISNSLPAFFLASLVLLTSGQRTASPKDSAESYELARQNRITQQILEHYLQRRLFPHKAAMVKPPSLEDILTINGRLHDHNIHQNIATREADDENLQSVESTQVNSVYEEAVYRYTTQRRRESHRQHCLDERTLESSQIQPATTDCPEEACHSIDCPHCEDEASISTPNRWTMPLLKLGEKNYYLGIFFRANWFKAAQYCRFHGMHLASISSQEENDKLEKYVRDSGYGNEHFWTSGTDLADEGSFFWMSSGRPITFTNWNAGEPNNFKYENGEEENCLELWNRDGKGLKWNDSPCSFETFFVCEVRND